uniref:Uncharacterized protein n=1 Tax=Oryza nivara TaxID=4536 RepID=A0A2I4S699_ORYNI|nr:hypothetical protein NIV_6 [Oryza sativa f. spontanea]
MAMRVGGGDGEQRWWGNGDGGWWQRRLGMVAFSRAAAMQIGGVGGGAAPMGDGDGSVADVAVRCSHVWIDGRAVRVFLYTLLGQWAFHVMGCGLWTCGGVACSLLG